MNNDEKGLTQQEAMNMIQLFVLPQYQNQHQYQLLMHHQHVDQTNHLVQLNCLMALKVSICKILQAARFQEHLFVCC